MPRKPRDPKKPADYDVGYGKPPPEHQFKKGQRVEGAGRPKGVKNLDTYIDEVLAEVMQHPTTGEPAPKAYFAAAGLVHKAIKGDVGAINALLVRGAKKAASEAAGTQGDLTPEEEAMLLDSLRRGRKLPGEDA